MCKFSSEQVRNLETEISTDACSTKGSGSANVARYTYKSQSIIQSPFSLRGGLFPKCVHKVELITFSLLEHLGWNFIRANLWKRGVETGSFFARGQNRGQFRYGGVKRSKSCSKHHLALPPFQNDLKTPGTVAKMASRPACKKFSRVLAYRTRYELGKFRKKVKKVPKRA